MSTPKSLFSRGSALSSGEMLSRSEAQAFLERVVKLSKADTIGAQLAGGYQGNIRFAANRITTSGGVNNSQLVVQSGYGAKHAVVTTADFSPEGIERAVRQSEAIAKLAPDDPENMPLLPPQQYMFSGSSGASLAMASLWRTARSIPSGEKSAVVTTACLAP